MSHFDRRSGAPTVAPVASAPGRFAGMAAIAHDPDECQSREDRAYGHTFFTRPWSLLPGWIKGRPRTG